MNFYLKHEYFLMYFKIPYDFTILRSEFVCSFPCRVKIAILTTLPVAPRAAQSGVNKRPSLAVPPSQDDVCDDFMTSNLTLIFQGNPSNVFSSRFCCMFFLQLFVLFEIIYTIRIFFNFILQIFNLSDLVFILLFVIFLL